MVVVKGENRFLFKVLCQHEVTPDLPVVTA